MIRALRPTAPALALLPALALVPVLIVVLQAVHGGGSEIWAAFLLGAVRPSLDPVLIGSLLRALQVTVATALTGWGCSLLIGVVLGCLSSERLGSHSLARPASVAAAPTAGVAAIGA